MRKLNYIVAPIRGSKSKFKLRESVLNKKLITDPKGFVFGLIFINMAIAIYLSLHLNIWLDEAYSLNTTSKNLIYAVHQALYFEFQPPFYFAFMTLWRDINPSIFFARFFSVVCISFSIYLIPLLNKRYSPEVNPIWATLLFALNPFTIWAAVEIRPYALIVLLSILLLIFFYDAYISKVSSKYSRWFYIICATIGLYTQYYLGFLLAANAGVLVFNRNWRALRKYLIDMIIPAAAIVFLIPQILWQVNLNSGYSGIKENFIKGIRFMYRRSEEYIIPFNDYLSGDALHWIFRLAIAGFFLYSVMPLIRNKFKKVKETKYYLWPTAAVLFLIFSGLLYYVGPYFLHEKHTALLFIPLLIIFVELIAHNKNKKIFGFWILFLVSFYSFALVMQYKDMAKSGDYIRVADYIMNHESKNEPILVFRREISLPLEYYYSGINKIVPIPKKFNFEGSYNYAESEWALKSENEVANTVSAVKNNPSEFWLLTNQQLPIYGHSVNSKYLENYIRKNYTVETYKKFYGTDLRLIKKK